MKRLLLALIGVLVITGATGVIYACPEASGWHTHCYCGGDKIDLKICDQDESWRDGVHATWTAENMAPGDAFAFTDSYVGLKSQLSRHTRDGSIAVTCNYNPWSAGQPDNMARYMVITRCVYNYTEGNHSRQIDCLTGAVTRSARWSSPRPPGNNDWQIRDTDNDGRITFYDLKQAPLQNLPAASGDASYFAMSVKFHETAGNEFQGDTFNLTLVYTLTPG